MSSRVWMHGFVLVSTAFVTLALLAASARSKDGDIVVPAPTVVQWLQMDADVKLLGSFEKGTTSRRVACSMDDAAGWRLVPRHVEVRGSLTQRFGSSGTLYRAFLGGSEGPRDALSEPGLAAFWASVQIESGTLRLGWLDTNERIAIPKLPKEVDLQRSDDPTPERVAIADGVLLAALAELPGAWTEDETRTVHIQLAHDEGEPEGVGRLRIGPLRSEEGETVVPLHMKCGGRKRSLGLHTLEAEGRLTVGVDGLLHRGEISVKSTFPDPRRPSRSGADRTTLRIVGRSDPIEEDQALEYARLVARSCDDPMGAARETLKETREVAFALLSRVRPDIDLAGWTVEVWESPPQEGGTWPPLSDTVALFDHVEPALEAHAETLGRFVPVRDAIERLARPPRPAYCVAPRAKTVWIHPDVVDEVRKVYLALVTSAHPDAGHPNLKRFGILGEATDWAFVDLDGLLATVLTVEGLTGCHALALVGGVPPNAAEAAKTLRSRTRGLLQPQPSADPDRQHTSWANRALGVMVRKIEAGDDLGDLVRRAWRTSTHRTRDLYLEGPSSQPQPQPTDLWRRARAFKSQGATGVTRVGAGLVAWLLLQDGRARVEVEATARALCDDVLVCTGTGCLWITRWARESEAQAWEKLQEGIFEQAKEPEGRAGTVRRRGLFVIATRGEVPAAWVGDLLE